MATSKTMYLLRAALVCVMCTVVSAQQSAAPSPATPQQPDAAAAGGPAPSARAGFSVVMEGDGLLVQRRRFEAGNRTYWHSHERGFLLLVERGRARTQRLGEAMKELAPGEVDYTPPGVLHWHGAAAAEEFIQIGVTFGGGITFTDPVTDAQYNGK